MIIFYIVLIFSTMIKYWYIGMGILALLSILFATISSIRTNELYKLLEEYKGRDWRYDG
jgi:hypothetical protein